MTHEDKKLLLNDLSGRLSSNTKISTPKGINILTSIEICLNDIIICSCPYGHFLIEEVKPYLRSMSSMTEEEENIVYNGHVQFWDREDYCNKHHLDYRGLIKKGIAIEVTEENNPYV